MRPTKRLVSVLTMGLCFLTAGAAWAQTYYVQSGDSLYSIAARYGTTVTALQQANGLSSGSIYPGQALSIGYQSSSTSGNYSRYTVTNGDTLYLIAQRYGVTVSALQQANGLQGTTTLWVGQTLKIPATSTASSSSATTSYVVRSGDTPFLIAQRYGISTSALLQANNLSSSASIYPGQTLKIPAKTSTSGSSYANFNLSQSDIDLLARLVTAESDGEPYLGQVAVAATILNRLRDDRYPKTIPGIIYQIDNGCYQYSPVLDGRINLPASSLAYQAVQKALTGDDPSNGGNGFYNPAKTSSTWVRSHPATAVIGNHVFFKY